MAKTYQKHGTHALERALNRFGSEGWLDKLGPAGDALREWRQDLIEDLGGDPSTAQLNNSQRVELLDHNVLVAQLGTLERRTSRGGRDSIDHPPRGRDDVANAVAGALLTACQAERQKATVMHFRL